MATAEHPALSSQHCHHLSATSALLAF